MGEISKNPITVFDTHGLLSRGAWRNAPIPSADGSDPARAFCKALEELGGLYGLFGRFLAWRSDLIDSGCINELSRIRTDYPPVPLAAAAETVCRELGEDGVDLAA
ncbi:MAG TPA: hypothetical protein VHC72_13325, partial [Bryobacteraceae bacterium]|nr:hypothetical protein [Bryobacteraceae bacterium]